MLLNEPFLGAMRDSSRNAECSTNLEFIAATMETGKGPLHCGPWPLEIPTEKAFPWTNAPPCWDTFGFERDLQLWGQYEVRSQGKGWVATCQLDLDGDGDAIVYEASHSHTAGLKAGTED